MDEKFNNDLMNGEEKNKDTNPEFNSEKVSNATEMRIENEQNNNVDINSFAMDEKGNIRSSRNGAVALSANPRIYIILGWVGAAFSAFLSPYFAIPGIIFGILASRVDRGKGTAIIIANILLAAVNLIFGMFIISYMRRMMYGY